MNKKYKASWTSSAVAVVAIFAIAILMVGLVNLGSSGLTLAGFLSRYLAGLFVFFCLWSVVIRTTRLEIAGDRLLRVSLVIERQTISISSIKSVRAGKMYGLVPVLDIIYEEGDATRTLKVNPNPFGEKMMREFIHDIKQLKADVVLDGSIEKLIIKWKV